jgi:hypothetical protein
MSYKLDMQIADLIQSAEKKEMPFAEFKEKLITLEHQKEMEQDLIDAMRKRGIINE